MMFVKNNMLQLDFLENELQDLEQFILEFDALCKFKNEDVEDSEPLDFQDLMDNFEGNQDELAIAHKIIDIIREKLVKTRFNA